MSIIMIYACNGFLFATAEVIEQTQSSRLF